MKYEELIPYLQLLLNVCLDEDEENEVKKQLVDYTERIENKKREIDRTTKEKEDEKKEAELVKQLTTINKYSTNLLFSYYEDYNKTFGYIREEKYSEVLLYIVTF